MVIRSVFAVVQMLIEAETDDGLRHSTLLQNAETVRLVCPSSSSNTPSSSSHSSSSSMSTPAQAGDDASSTTKQAWQAVSVSTLQPGQKVFLLMQEGARHTGISIREQIKEC